MKDYHIQAINAIREASKQLLYYGEEASGTVMEAYYRIIESENEQEIADEISGFKNFVLGHNQEYIGWKQKDC